MYAVAIPRDPTAIMSDVRAFAVPSEYTENKERSTAASPIAPAAETIPTVAVQLR
jgi:hypothetical protein